MTRPGGHNRFSVSDELQFWADHLHPRDMPDPEPMTEPEPDVSAMSLEEFAQNRQRLGLPDTGDFIGVRQWRRPQPSMNEE